LDWQQLRLLVSVLAAQWGPSVRWPNSSQNTTRQHKPLGVNVEVGPFLSFEIALREFQKNQRAKTFFKPLTRPKNNMALA
jgi:hypothetical protein